MNVELLAVLATIPIILTSLLSFIQWRRFETLRGELRRDNETMAVQLQSIRGSKFSISVLP